MISDANEYHAWMNHRIENLKPLLEEAGHTTEDLDAMVRDCLDEKATEINNTGIEAQLFLLLKSGWTPEDIIGRARIAKEDSSSDEGSTPTK